MTKPSLPKRYGETIIVRTRLDITDEDCRFPIKDVCGKLRMRNLHVSSTGFLGEMEHLKIMTRLIDEMFSSVMGENVFSK